MSKFNSARFGGSAETRRGVNLISAGPNEIWKRASAGKSFSNSALFSFHSASSDAALSAGTKAIANAERGNKIYYTAKRDFLGYILRCVRTTFASSQSQQLACWAGDFRSWLAFLLTSSFALFLSDGGRIISDRSEALRNWSMWEFTSFYVNLKDTTILSKFL
jgi:hypothetical protein